MTVCIAAAYEDQGKAGVALCCDWRVEVDVASSETVDKLGFIKKGWPTLIADSISDADALLETYIHDLQSETFTDDNIRTLIERGAEKRKAHMINHHTLMKHGLTFDQFQNSKNIIPPTRYKKTWEEISEMNLQAYVLIAGCIDNQAYILKVQPDGTVFSHDHFAAIGAGDALAETWLHMRSHDDETNLTGALYNVYEAKRFSEMHGPVGIKYTSLYVLKPDGEVYSLTKSSREHLKQRYEDFLSTSGRTLPQDLLENEPEAPLL
jgi:hypothetical protein